MRLKSVQLSGFKTFVDTSTIEFPSNFSAIVGPNGCGKSNVVDAVRMVIGESQASHLRSDTLSDLIFNGASTRAPASQASIELVFENEDGKIGGEFASYSELSIRREIFRDVESKFWLNNRRCRRRDIQDIFRGTGLVARGYSIIEQGLINRLIEAKPDELRGYVEEAAGISKYRDRRRETERNLQTTQDNLERVRDHASELNRQIQKLRRQANELKRYNELKQLERVLQATLLAAEVTKFNSQLESQDQAIAQSNLALQRIATALQSKRTDLLSLRQEESKAIDLTGAIQGEFYATRAQIAQIEQVIDSHEMQIKDLRDEHGSSTEQRRKLEEEIEDGNETILQLDVEIEQLNAERSHAQHSVDDADERLTNSQTLVAAWQTKWAEVDREVRESQLQSRELDYELKDTESKLRESKIEMVRLDEEFSSQPPANEDTAPLQEEYELLEREYDAVARAFSDTESTLAELEQSAADCELRSKEIEKESLSVRDELTANVAMQEQMLGKTSERQAASNWLTQHSLANAKRLGDVLSVVEGWEFAVERVLAAFLDAVQVEELNLYADAFATVDNEAFTLYESASASQTTDGRVPLNSKILGTPAQITPFIEGVFVAESLQEAFQVRPTLAPGESVVTKDGTIVGPHWIRFNRRTRDEILAVERGSLISSLQSDMASIDARKRTEEQKLQSIEELRNQAQAKRESLQKQLYEKTDQISKAKLDLKTRELNIEKAQETRTRLLTVREELRAKIDRGTARRDELLEQKPAVDSRKLTWETKLRELTQSQEENQLEMNTALNLSRDIHEKTRQIDVQLSKTSSNREAIATSSERLGQELIKVGTRIEEIQQTLEQLQTALPQSTDELESALANFATVEDRLAKAQADRDRITNEIRTISTEAFRHEQESSQAQESLSELREARAKLVAQRDQLVVESKQLPVTEAEIAELASEFAIQEIEARLTRTSRRIERMGAINMAAIQDLEHVEEEKELIDRQVEDIEMARQNLTTTIGDLDRKTKTMFMETFNAIDHKFDQVFRRLFKGGSAGLELLDPDDRLNTGVVINATPPGKKNKSIAILSGGEKALTAIALVFAIFELNPSPVCLLDEVDAHLDEPNVVRFCELLNEMAHDVQFVVISHNVHTVSCADHLIGVSMGEAGISRIVTAVLKQAREGLSANAAG